MTDKPDVKAWAVEGEALRKEIERRLAPMKVGGTPLDLDGTPAFVAETLLKSLRLAMNLLAGLEADRDENARLLAQANAELDKAERRIREFAREISGRAAERDAAQAALAWQKGQVKAMEVIAMEAKAVLSQVEWSAGGRDIPPGCPSCFWTHGKGHAPDCRLKKALDAR